MLHHTCPSVENVIFWVCFCSGQWTVLHWKLLQELKLEACENIKALNILKMVDCRWLLNGSLSTKWSSYEMLLPYVLWCNNFTILIKNMGVLINYNYVTHLQSHIFLFIHETQRDIFSCCFLHNKGW